MVMVDRNGNISVFDIYFVHCDLTHLFEEYREAEIKGWIIFLKIE